MNTIVVVAYVVGIISVLSCAMFVGAMIERRRVSSALRRLPISQEEFEYCLDYLGLDDNPFDHRTLGAE